MILWLAFPLIWLFGVSVCGHGSEVFGESKLTQQNRHRMSPSQVQGHIDPALKEEHRPMTGSLEYSDTRRACIFLLLRFGDQEGLEGLDPFSGRQPIDHFL